MKKKSDEKVRIWTTSNLMINNKMLNDMLTSAVTLTGNCELRLRRRHFGYAKMIKNDYRTTLSFFYS